MKKLNFCKTEDGESCLKFVIEEIVLRINEELPKVINNILDPRTSPKKAREINVKIKFVANEERVAIGLAASVSAKLQPAGSVLTSLHVVPDEKGEVVIMAALDHENQTKLL